MAKTLCNVLGEQRESVKACAPSVWATGHLQRWHCLVPMLMLWWELNPGKLLLGVSRRNSAVIKKCPLVPIALFARLMQDFHIAWALWSQHLDTCSIQLTNHTSLWLKFLSSVRQSIDRFWEPQQSWEDVLIALSIQTKCAFTWWLLQLCFLFSLSEHWINYTLRRQKSSYLCSHR